MTHVSTADDERRFEYSTQRWGRPENAPGIRAHFRARFPALNFGFVTIHVYTKNDEGGFSSDLRIDRGR